VIEPITSFTRPERRNGGLIYQKVVIMALSRSSSPLEVGTIFEALRNEVTFLHGIWDAYDQLFGTQEAVAALNETAPGAFSLIGYVFRHELVMAFSRITDPKATGKKENLTLQRLLHVVSEHTDDRTFVNGLESKLSAINASCEPFRDRRNRSIGHLDLSTALNSHPNPLPAIEREQILQSLRLVAEFMNEVLGHYTSAHADFVPHVTGPARNIVHGLSEFQRLRNREYEQEVAALRAEEK
jgi:hypothetical protein